MREQRKKVRAFLGRYGLIQPGDRVVAAVSGGLDSVVMAHLLLSLREELGFDLILAQFDHGLRPESREEQAFVAALADQWQVPFQGGGADVRALARGRNLEDTARRKRYRFLRQVAAQWQAASIATAHHRDDQAETVLQHLLRGSGLSGLSGVSPQENGVIRPLLCLERAEIAAYAAQAGLEYRQDLSNFDQTYQRNRIRLSLLPTLAEYNPQVVEALNATADICREEDALMEDLAENALAEAIDPDNRLYLPALLEQPLALRRRVIRKLYCLRVGDRRDLSFGQVEAALSLREGQSVTLPGGVKLFCRDNWLDLAAEVPPLPSHDQSIPLKADGCWRPLADWGWDYCCAGTDRAPLPGFGPLADEQAFVWLAEKDLLPKLRWRTRRPGDKIPSRGRSGRRKVKDLFIQEKILPSARESWPLLLAEETICWVPGLWKPGNPDVQGDKLLIKVRRSDNIKR